MSKLYFKILASTYKQAIDLFKEKSIYSNAKSYWPFPTGEKGVILIVFKQPGLRPPVTDLNDFGAAKVNLGTGDFELLLNVAKEVEKIAKRRT